MPTVFVGTLERRYDSFVVVFLGIDVAMHWLFSL